MTIAKVTLEIEGPVGLLRFGNPPRGTMDGAMEEEFAAAVDALEGNHEVRAVILTGAQKGVFVRHYDVGALESRGRALRERGLSFNVARAVPEVAIHRALRAIETSAKPYIAALNGSAMGGGFEIALACDLRIAQDGPYDLGLPEINIGLLPGAGGTQRLARAIGEARALELILLGRTLAPSLAAARGLVHECVDDALARARELAGILAAKPPLALAHIKRLVRAAAGRAQADGLADERTLFCELLTSDGAIERMAEMNAGNRDIRTI